MKNLIFLKMEFQCSKRDLILIKVQLLHTVQPLRILHICDIKKMQYICNIFSFGSIFSLRKTSSSMVFWAVEVSGSDIFSLATKMLYFMSF
jgi:ABC-type multidrug transport system permease subunit